MKVKKLGWTCLAFVLCTSALAQNNIGFKKFIDEFDKSYAEACKAQNFELIRNYYSSDVRLMPEYQTTVFSLENTQQYYTAFFQRFGISDYSRNNIEVNDLGDRLIALGSFEMTLIEAGKSYPLKGKYLTVWAPKNDGTFELVTEAWNYNHWVDFSNRLRFRAVPAKCVALSSHIPLNNDLSFEIAAYNALSEKFITQHNSEVWSLLYADDGMFMYSHNPIYAGRQALDKFLKKHTNEMAIFEHLDIRTDEVLDLENGFILEYGSHVANWRSADNSGVSTGKNIRLWRRADNGRLELFRQIAMYD